MQHPIAGGTPLRTASEQLLGLRRPQQQGLDGCSRTLAAWSTVPRCVGQDGTCRAMTEAARYLLRNVTWLRHQPFAGEALDQIDRAVRKARYAIDLPADRAYVGRCGAEYDTEDGPAYCSRDLYVRPKAKTATCPTCHTEHDVPARRQWLLDAVDDVLVTSRELSRILTLYGEAVTQDRLRKWRQRGQLVAHSTSPEGEPLYLVREVRQVVADFVGKQRRRAPVA